MTSVISTGPIVTASELSISCTSMTRPTPREVTNMTEPTSSLSAFGAFGSSSQVKPSAETPRTDAPPPPMSTTSG